ncbi:MAG: CDP-diacylglycerol--serine O-phosphatidyltransferase [Methanolobus sp. T82-4]|nr:MAG: CDP-diacylglycerol--serine O-phosphatidyltransferase [Methanolobus sp. T82-4]
MSEKGIKMKHEEKLHDRELGPCWVAHESEIKSVSPQLGERISEKLFVPGKDKLLLKEIISLINSAKEQICLASFLISDAELVDALLKAAEKGVDIYLLTASEAKLESEPAEDNEFEKKTTEEHKKLLGKLVGKVLVRTAHHLHTKFVIVDPNSDKPCGFILTSNLTTEALIRNPEIGVKIYGNEVKDLFQQFCTGFWNESERELLEAGKLSVVGETMRGYVPESFTSSYICYTTSRMSTIQENIIKLINDSKGELWACAFGFQQDNKVMETLVNASKQGRKVTVLARPRPHISSRDALLDIVQNGGNVYGLDWLHAKCIVAMVNGKYTAVVMTANIEDRSMVTGFETGILLDGKEAENLKDLMEYWMTQAQYKLENKVKRGDIQGKVKLWDGDKFVDKSVEPLYERNMGSLQAKKGKDVATAKPKSFPLPPDSTKLYHVHRYTWTALPAKQKTAT